MSLGHTKCDLSVVLGLKTVRMPCSSRQRQRGSDKTAVDLNSAVGSLLGAVLALVIFCIKEEEYLLETSTDDRCFFSSEMTFRPVVQTLQNTTFY